MLIKNPVKLVMWTKQTVTGFRAKLCLILFKQIRGMISLLLLQAVYKIWDKFEQAFFYCASNIQQVLYMYAEMKTHQNAKSDKIPRCVAGEKG